MRLRSDPLSPMNKVLMIAASALIVVDLMIAFGVIRSEIVLAGVRYEPVPVLALPDE